MSDSGRATLPFLDSLTRRETEKVENGVGMLFGGVLVGGIAGMILHARGEYQHKQMYGHMTSVEQSASKSKLLRLMGTSGLKYGGFVATFVGFELAMARMRGKDDDMNVCAAGAITGGAFCARGGAAATIAGSVMGCSLAYITSAGLDILQNVERIMIVREREAEEMAMLQKNTPEEDTTIKEIARFQSVLAEWPEQEGKKQ